MPVLTRNYIKDPVFNSKECNLLLIAVFKEIGKFFCLGLIVSIDSNVSRKSSILHSKSVCKEFLVLCYMFLFAIIT